MIQYFFIIIIILSASCNNTVHVKNENIDIKVELNEISRGMPYRDSLFVIETCNQFIELNERFYDMFEDINKFRIDNIITEHISYNNDSLKMVSLFTINYTSLVTDSIEGFYLKDSSYTNAMAIIGYRKNKNLIWEKVYPFNQIVAGLFPTKKLAINKLTEYYFNEMANDKIGVTKYDDSKNIISEYHKINYTLKDSLFWMESPFWKLGLRLDGYYAFEVANNAGEVYPNRIIKMPNCNYSDTLQNMYSD